MPCRMEPIAKGPQKKKQRPKKKVRLIPPPDQMRRGKPCGAKKEA